MEESKLTAKEIFVQLTILQKELTENSNTSLHRLGDAISSAFEGEEGDTPEKAYTEVVLQDLACEVLNELEEEIKKRNITATITGEGKIVADQNMIFELIENLLSNAVKYNKDGGSVSVTITDTTEGVCLQVKDTGIGIEKEHLPRLCERFYRVDKSHSKRIGGTGLGLAIVKHICAIYNADLSIESEFGEGTTFTVVFSKNAGK